MIPLKIPHLLRCIRAESLKLKVVDYDRSLSFELIPAPCIRSILSGILFQDFSQYNQDRTIICHSFFRT